MNNLNDRNDSIVEILLCNEKIQEENLAIKNEVNRLNVLLEKAEADRKDIQKYMDEIENIVERCGKLEQKNGEVVNEENNKSKFDKGATLAAVFMISVVGIINILNLIKSEDWKSKHELLLYLADVFTIAVNCEIIFHTGYFSRWDRNSIYIHGTRVLYTICIVIIIFASDLCNKLMPVAINIFSPVALIYSFYCNYKERN